MNSVELIGVVKEIELDQSNNQYLVLEVQRPYLDNKQAFISDDFKVYKWGILNFGTFNNINKGMQVAIRGHLVNNELETIIISEYLKILYYPKQVII